MKSSIIIFSMIFFATTLRSMPPTDQICGTWLNEEGNTKIEIFEKSGKYYGKITWIKDPNDSDGKPKTDKSNPDIELKTQPIVGLTIISNLTYKKGKWMDGIIYLPQKGQTASCSLSLNNPDELELHVSKYTFSSTKIWTRL